MLFLLCLVDKGMPRTTQDLLLLFLSISSLSSRFKPCSLVRPLVFYDGCWSCTGPAMASPLCMQLASLPRPELLYYLITHVTLHRFSVTEILLCITLLLEVDEKHSK